MRKHPTEKAAERLVSDVARMDFNESVFSGILMDQPYNVQRRLVETFVYYLKVYKRNADNPHLAYRTDPTAARVIETVDLTAFDK